MITQPATNLTLDGEIGAAPERAVVIGCSFAGLLAARVLADHFREVIIVERDRLPELPEFRKGVPQSRHLHVLLDGGRTVLEQLLPGFGEEMRAAGAIQIEMPKDALWLAAAGWGRRYAGRMDLLSASRNLVEWSVRGRVSSIVGVQILGECEAVELLTNSARSVVTGVRITRRAGGAAGDEPGAGGTSDLMAAIVVDAAGRRSRAGEWLEQLGYPAIEETVVNAFLGYASRQYRIPPDSSRDWKILFIQAKAPENARTGYLFPIEGDRWMLSMMGAAHDYPPTDDEGFLAFARGLRSPIVYETIKDAEPLSPVFGYGSTENRRRHFEQLARRPENFVVIGDAACAFNPVYGQGITVAAKSALTLNRCLRERRRHHGSGDLTGLAHRFQRAIAKTTDDAWLIATGEDLRYPTTEGAKLDLPTRLTHRYLDRVIATATQEPIVGRAFMNVVNLAAPPRSLFRPGVLLRVLRGVRPPSAPERFAGPRLPQQVAEEVR